MRAHLADEVVTCFICSLCTISYLSFAGHDYTQIVMCSPETAIDHVWATGCASGYDCGRVPDLQSGGCGFESQPGLLRTKVYSAFHPFGSANEYQLRLGRQRQVWLTITDERVGVQVKL